MLADIHIHLDDEKYDVDREEVIARAKEKGVSRIITAGLDHKTNLASLALAKKYEIVKAALGRYPDDCNITPHTTTVEEDVTFIKKHKDEIIAISEIGLDLHEGTKENLSKQKESFFAMIKLSKELKKPMIIHSRKAEEETLNVLEEEKVPSELVVMHCFSGKKALMKRGIELGYSFSIPTNITRAENFRLLVELCPLKQLFTETDGPYLSPYKNEDGSFNRNEPGYVDETIKIIAEIKKITPEECKNQLFMNYQRMFR